MKGPLFTGPEADARRAEKLPFRMREGWWWPRGARAAHYMRDGVSLCGKFRDPALLPSDKGRMPERCWACRRAVASERGARRRHGS